MISATTAAVTLHAVRTFSFSAMLVMPGFLALGGCGGPSGSPDIGGVAPESTSGTQHLTATEVQNIIAQAATQAVAMGEEVTIAVVDHEGFVLGVLQMAGAPSTTTISGGGLGGLEGASVSARFAAISKAGTAAFFSTQGSAFTTRTASFIVQDHFPPGVSPSPGGPLFGVQFSSLRCSDVSRTGHHPAVPPEPDSANLPLGLSADPGGLPLYKNGTAVGGIGVEGDGLYTLDPNPADDDQSREEIIAAAGTVAFSAPSGIQAGKVLVDGMRFPFANADPPAIMVSMPYSAFATAPGAVEDPAPRDSPATGFIPASFGGVSGTVDPGIPVINSVVPAPPMGLTAAEVSTIIGQAAAQAEVTRAAIRLPLGSKARVSITVVDTGGNILGIFRTLDAPLFGFDVSAQKARTANFFTRPQARTELDAVPALTSYVTAARADGIDLDGSIAFSDRAVGFLSQPIYPPGGIAAFSHGPFSKSLGTWSIFNTGLQLDIVQARLVESLTMTVTSCTTALSRLQNGIQIFPGSVPLYKNEVHVGAIGISGDGVDQDDLIAFSGSAGFEAPENIRSDTLSVRGTRLPFAVFPRHPNL